MLRNRLGPALFLLAILAGASGCGSSTTTVVSPSPLAGRCGVTLNVTSASVSAAGGSGTVRVQTDRECAWSIPQQPSWVKISQSLAMQGPAEIPFVVDENRSTATRSWEVVVSGQRAVVSQAAATCTWKVSPSAITVGAAGGESRTILTTEEFCLWALPATPPWISMTPDRGQGTAEISVRVSRNTGGERTEKVRISEVVIDITQREAPPTGTPPVPPSEPTPAPEPNPPSEPTPPSTPPPSTPPPSAPPPSTPPPSTPPPSTPPPSTPPPSTPPPSTPPPSEPAVCTFKVNPLKFADVPAAGEVVQVDVVTSDSCSWAAESSSAWLALSGGTRTGSGRVSVTVSPNSAAARSASVTVAGQVVTIAQGAAPPCTYSLAPSSFSTSATAASISVALSTATGCAWTVSGTPSWVTVSPASGSGAATLKIAVSTNTGAARSAVLMIGGREFRVEQAAAPCAYTVTPDKLTLSARRQNAKITVTTQSHCHWAVVGGTPWAAVTWNISTGTGEVQVRVEENTRSESRSTTVLITGQNFAKPVSVVQGGED